MTKNRIAGLVWLLLAGILLQLAPSDALALTYYWGRHPDKERLVIVFPDKIPAYTVSRTGRTSLRITLPEDYWTQEAKPQPANFASAKLLKRVRVLRDALEIQVANPAFGYIQFPLKDRGKLVVDVFPDPIGSRWKPAGEKSPPKKKKKARAPAPKKPVKQVEPVVSTPKIKVPIAPRPEQKKSGSAPGAKAPSLGAQPKTAQPQQPEAETIRQQPQTNTANPAVAPAPVKKAQPVAEPSKGGMKPAPEVKAAAKPDPRPGVATEPKPAKPAAQTITVKVPETNAETMTGPGQAGSEAEKASGPQPQTVKSTPPPVVELPEEKSSVQPSSGQTKQPFYTVPYSYRAPIIKDSAPLHNDTSSKASPQQAAPQPQEKKLPESKPQSSLFFDFPVSTAIAAEIHPPPQQLLAQNQATEPEKETFTIRHRIAPPSATFGEPQTVTTSSSPDTTPAKTAADAPAGRDQPVQPPQSQAASSAPSTPQPPNPVPETTAYMENETPAQKTQAPAAPAKPAATTKPYAVRNKIQRPGEEAAGPLSRDALNSKPVSPEPEQAASQPAARSQARSAAQTTAPAETIPAPGSPPAQGVPWSGEQQLSMPLSEGPAPEAAAAQDAPAATQQAAPLEAPQRIRPPVVRTSPLPETAQEVPAPEAADATPAASEPADAAAASKLPSDADLEELDSPYKAARQEQAQQGQQAEGEEPLPDFQQIMITGKAAMANEDYQNAYDVFEGLLKHPKLPSNFRKEILYLAADALYSLSQDNMEENYSKIMSAYNEALNYDPDSIKAPQALYHMGVANLKVGNAREAEAYFNIFKDKYPDDPQIPMIYYQWGQFYFERKEYRKAADEFQYVVQKYPDNKVTLPASVFLARSLNELGLDEAAYKIVDYVQKRWPRYYTQYPPVLKLMGDVFYRMGELERAKAAYWTYYNLDPKGEEADVILARLGDIYLQTDHKETAVRVYEQNVNEFPNKEGGLISQMRLAEQGVYDKPTIQQMFSIFDRPYTLKPSQVYTMIVDKFPDSPLAPLAQIKLSMWHLWNREYKAAINDSNAFLEKFPKDALLDSAREVGTKAFGKLLELYIPEENYQAAVTVWEDSPLLQSNEPNLTPKSRVELATCFWKDGKSDKADKLLEPFFLSAAMPEQAQNALLLALNIALQKRDWKRILDLGKKVELWDLDPKARYELDYNTALAYENEGNTDKSAELWNKLADTGDTDPKQEAYILYFLAQNAREKGEFKKAYRLAQQSLDYFLQDRSDQQKIKDLLALLIDITDTAGRTREALKWAIEYSRYVNRNDPDWPALRYRMAQLYKKLADMRKWRSILEELTRTMPGTLYGRMAKSDLNSQSLEQKAQQFVPSQNL